MSIETYDIVSNTMRPVTQEEFDHLLCWHQALGCVTMDYKSDPNLSPDVKGFIQDVVSTFNQFRSLADG